MAALKTATICGVGLAAGVLAGAWYLASRGGPADSGTTLTGPEPVAGMHPVEDSPPARIPAQSPAADGTKGAGGGAQPAEAPPSEGFDSLQEYLVAPEATVEAWLMPTGGLDVGRANEFSEPGEFDRLLWLLEEHANADLQDEAARWLQQLYALENGSDAVVTLDIACGQSLCASRLQSSDAAALDRFIAGVRKHHDFPMYTTMQMVFPDNPAGIRSRGLIFTTHPSANFVVIPKEMADGIVPTEGPEDVAPHSM
jgi:hypothetical protein